MTRIMAVSGLRQKARPEDPGQWAPKCLRHRPTRTLARRWCRNTRRMNRARRRPWRRAIRSRSSRFAADPGESLPLVPARPAAVHAQLSLGRIVLRVALDGDDIDGVRLVRVNVDHEP